MRFSTGQTINKSKTSKLNREGRLAFLLTFPALIIILSLIAYPLGYSLVSSFYPQSGNFGIGNYASILKDKFFWVVFINTLKFTVVIVSIEVLTGLLVAICLEKLNTHFKNFFRAIFILPLLMSPVVASYEWMWLFNDQYGLVPHMIKLLGIKPPLFLVEPIWAFFSIVIVDMWIATPFVILVFQSSLASLPRDPYECADIEGATRLQQFWYITLPLLKPAFLIILIIRTMDVFRIYDAVVVLTGGGPGLFTTSMSLLAFRTGINFGQLGKASAMSILITIPILIVTVIYLKVFVLKKD